MLSKKPGQSPGTLQQGSRGDGCTYFVDEACHSLKDLDLIPVRSFFSMDVIMGNLGEMNLAVV